MTASVILFALLLHDTVTRAAEQCQTQATTCVITDDCCPVNDSYVYCVGSTPTCGSCPADGTLCTLDVHCCSTAPGSLKGYCDTTLGFCISCGGLGDACGDVGDGTRHCCGAPGLTCNNNTLDPRCIAIPGQPTNAPTPPTNAPTRVPTAVSTPGPTSAPTVVATPGPTRAPTNAPTVVPSTAPTATTRAPSASPTAQPTAPTDDLEEDLTGAPTEAPTTGQPTLGTGPALGIGYAVMVVVLGASTLVAFLVSRGSFARRGSSKGKSR